ncbi:DUF7118 family protein [Natrarchaeobius chitinivorans]|uniref:Uncharacterized protein n=1 Tax=Natrarchaeobius chitinivorans TaxID=1679083 RepID=A0A3N6MK86_NATCH|nr:hypothetical protein [Natrarchaeobius chitinivorans]RQG94666.1 hypothetical protein EA473_11340 [Natrarchaeobius chitinivorans]
MSERAHSSGSSATDAAGTGSQPLEQLESARNRFERAERAIDDHGGETAEDATDAVEHAAEAYRNATDLLDSYVDRATGTGRENFKAYVQLEGQFAALVDGLPEELQGRNAFEDALEAIDKRRLSESDFERAHDALEPASRYAELIDERERARETLSEARTAASKRLREINDEIDERERLLELATADLEAPVDRLRDPIDRYNDLIREAFEEYRLEASVREVFALLERSHWYPFVEFERPPEDLRTYVRESSDGEYTIPKLLEYADYSRSKLAHYVEDADVLKRRVATQRTFLDGIDAEPLTVEWPPGEAELLRRRTREIRPFVARVANEETVAALRAVRQLTYDADYDRLQTAAQAVAQLTPEERERLASGRVETELETLRTERERLEAALEVDDPI